MGYTSEYANNELSKSAGAKMGKAASSAVANKKKSQKPSLKNSVKAIKGGQTKAWKYKNVSAGLERSKKSLGRLAKYAKK